MHFLLVLFYCKSELHEDFPFFKNPCFIKSNVGNSEINNKSY